MNNKLIIPLSIVLAAIIIAGAIIFATNQGGGNTAQSGSGVTAKDLSYQPDQFKTLMENAGVNNRTLGSSDAPITIVEYSDTECPFCNRFHDTMKKVMQEYGTDGTVAWNYKHFPIAQLHSKAPKEARALECIRSEGGAESFWTGVDALYTITPGDNKLSHDKLPAIAEVAGVNRSEFSKCLSSDKHSDIVQNHIEEARARGGSGTPFSVIELSDSLFESKRTQIKDLDKQLSQERELSQISQDGTEIKMSGAIPFRVMKQLIDTISA
jgi:protein-disulfide isomerase